jgi:ABC-type uncharacterized transport system substrate-binding protein
MIRRLWLGIVLIALASSVLLVSDWGRRQAQVGRMPRVAILQHASQQLLEDGVQGMLQGLATSGFVDGKNIQIQRFNAENDVGISNAIARQLVNGEYDLVLTSSTRSLQAVANANKDGKVKHVFGIVADPSVAGVGVSATDPLDHPRHLAGIGSFVPVDKAFELARLMYPALKSVGVAWNPSEANSEAFTIKAREAARKLGIELVETSIENSSGVGEAAESLVSRGVQAIWVGGDVTVLVAVEQVLAAAKKGRIPVFSIVPPVAPRGALFDRGANFILVGRETGELAAQVLHGADMSKIPIRNSVPQKVIINLMAVKDLKDPWRIPKDVIESADVVIDEKGVHEKIAPRATAIGKKWKVRVIELIHVVDVEETEKGVMLGLKESGLVEGRDYEVKTSNAQGDMATVNALVQAAVGEGADLLITLSTPTLQAALRAAGSIPVVFGYVASPIAAGAGRTDQDHAPNVTGVYFRTDMDEMISLVKEFMPNAKRLGTLFVPAEVNSVVMKDLLVEAMRKQGMEAELMGVSSSTEVADAALALCSKNIDAICQIPGNLTAAAFSSIAPAAKRSKLPIFAFQTVQAGGSVALLARDYLEAGRETGLMAARVMRGENPAQIPFQPLQAPSRLIVNREVARWSHLTVPPAVLKRALQVIGN